MGLKENLSKPAPRWFRKTKRFLTPLVDGSIIILLALGYADNSLIILILRIGYGQLIIALEGLLANGEIYAKNE
jgi:uncharacterized RDD family membrane protein YckC